MDESYADVTRPILLKTGIPRVGPDSRTTTRKNWSVVLSTH